MNACEKLAPEEISKTRLEQIMVESYDAASIHYNAGHVLRWTLAATGASGVGLVIVDP